MSNSESDSKMNVDDDDDDENPDSPPIESIIIEKSPINMNSASTLFNTKSRDLKEFENNIINNSTDNKKVILTTSIKDNESKHFWFEANSSTSAKQLQQTKTTNITSLIENCTKASSPSTSSSLNDNNNTNEDISSNDTVKLFKYDVNSILNFNLKKLQNINTFIENSNKDLNKKRKLQQQEIDLASMGFDSNIWNPLFFNKLVFFNKKKFLIFGYGFEYKLKKLLKKSKLMLKSIPKN